MLTPLPSCTVRVGAFRPGGEAALSSPDGLCRLLRLLGNAASALPHPERSPRSRSRRWIFLFRPFLFLSMDRQAGWRRSPRSRSAGGLVRRLQYRSEGGRALVRRRRAPSADPAASSASAVGSCLGLDCFGDGVLLRLRLGPACWSGRSPTTGVVTTLCTGRIEGSSEATSIGVSAMIKGFSSGAPSDGPRRMRQPRRPSQARRRRSP